MVQREPRQQQVVDAGAPTAKALDSHQVVVDLTETSEPQLDVDLRPDLAIAARDLHVASAYERFVKPGIDRILAIVIYLLLVPLLLTLILAIRGTMGRPAIFRQQRVGKDGQPFTMYKLRTMRTDRRVEQISFDGPDRRRVHKTPGDPRITRLGGFLRKWSLDEIPQLINVALGQMSLVGPRPELVEIVDTKYEPWQHQRHAVKPGLTGLWQISEQRQELMYQATHIDLEYLSRISLREDLRILALTIPAALGKRSSF